MDLDRWLTMLRLRARSLFDRGRLDRDLDDELRDHLARETEALAARGLPPAEARARALATLGGVEGRKEEMRDARGINAIAHAWRDLRLALRLLRKQPTFTVTALVSLALGIGANTAMFQLLDALSLRPLPVSAPQELVELRLNGSGRDGRHTGRNRQLSLPLYQAVLERQQAFDALVAFSDTRFNLASTGEVRYVEGLWVSGGFFGALGVAPQLGRMIAPDDDRTRCKEPVAVISDALWHREYGGDSSVIGRQVTASGWRPTIVGVAPASFFGVEVGRQFDIAMPLCASGYGNRDHWWLAAIGRLKPGVTRERAFAQIQQVMPDALRDALPDYNATLTEDYFRLTPDLVDASAGVSPLRRSYSRPLVVIIAIASLVLLIAAVNLANLLLARATARRREFTVRLALGASRRRILQQVFTESLVLAALGSIAAVAVAAAVSRAIPPLLSTIVDRVHLDLALDWRVLGFALGVGLTTSLIFGMAPAITAARTTALGGGPRGAGSVDGLRLRRALVSMQVGVTLVLLFGGLLFFRSLWKLSTADTGVNERGVVVANVFFSPREETTEARRARYAEIDARLAALPGMLSLSEAYTTPLGGSFWSTDIATPGQRTGSSFMNLVSPGYFATLGTPITSGRDFDARDVPTAPAVAMVNAAFAAKYLEGPALGQRFTIVADRPGDRSRELLIVGVVGNQKYGDMREIAPPIFYQPSSQLTELSLVRRYVARGSEPPARTVAAIGAAIAAVDPGAGTRFAFLDAQMGEGMMQERLMARLSTVFAGVALALAGVGLYGVVAYTAAARRTEIGVRLALGATRKRIVGLMLGEVNRMLIFGIAVGAAGAMALGSLVGTLLFEVSGRDLATLAFSIALLTAAATGAALVAAWRAARVDPLIALRD